MRKVVAVSPDAETRQAAQTVLKQIEATAGYVTAWQVAGPYRQDGKDYAALFDIAFAPERTETQDVHWQPLPAGADPARPWSMDLLKALGGEQCVAYARTGVHSDQERAARLEMGSDDGLKVWLNGSLVHANNTARPLTPGSDRVDVTLRQGWNTLVLKVTQNNLGWEFCSRIVGPDGSPLEGLGVDASSGTGPLKEGGGQPDGNDREHPSLPAGASDPGQAFPARLKRAGAFSGSTSTSTPGRTARPSARTPRGR